MTGEIPPHQNAESWRVVAVNHGSRTMDLMAIAVPLEPPVLRRTPLVGLFSPPPRLMEFYGVVGDTIAVAFPPDGFVVAAGLGPDARSAGGFDVVLAGVSTLR